MILIFPINGVLCARMGLGCCNKIALVYSKRDKISTPKLFHINTALTYSKTFIYVMCN